VLNYKITILSFRAKELKYFAPGYSFSLIGDIHLGHLLGFLLTVLDVTFPCCLIKLSATIPTLNLIIRLQFGHLLLLFSQGHTRGSFHGHSELRTLKLPLRNLSSLSFSLLSFSQFATLCRRLCRYHLALGFSLLGSVECLSL
jgi:hypothetical protein